LNNTKIEHVKVEMQTDGEASFCNEDNFDLRSILSENFSMREKNPGTYDKIERINKILKYKAKQRNWRRLHPVSKRFEGRSSVAGQKYRIKGKFVKPEIYEAYMNKKTQS